MIETPINRMRICVRSAINDLENEYLYSARISINNAIDIYEKDIKRGE